MMKTLLAAVAMLMLAACGSMGNTSGATAADAAAYSQLAVSASSAVASYRQASATMATPAACRTDVDDYAAQMQGMVARMQEMAPRMDGHMAAMGQTMGADMQCGTGVMAQELMHHLSVAYTMADMTANAAEAARHADAMQGYADHMQMRAAEMAEMANRSGGMMGGASGSGMMDGGWQMPDGGMMGWDHTIPGCTPGAAAR